MWFVPTRNFSGTPKTKSWKSYQLRTSTAKGYYLAGYYEAPATDVTLSQASTTQTYGSANIAYAAHAFIVVAGAGTVDAGSCAIRVTGTSITDDGVRTTSDSETIVPSITAMLTNAYYETSKKWLGQVTFELVPDGAATYSATFNYGFSKYEDFSNSKFTLTDCEFVIDSQNADSGIDIELFHHKATLWTYSAAAFHGHPTAIASMATDHGADVKLESNGSAVWKRANLSTLVRGDLSEGIVVKVTTGSVNSIEYLNGHIGYLP